MVWTIQGFAGETEDKHEEP